MKLPRSSGILAHVTSLPGRLGIGDLGPNAHRFVGELAGMAQSWWQMLPVGPTGYADSPYQSPSTFAGNPLLVSPDLLVEEGLVDPRWLEDLPTFPEDRVDFGAVISWRGDLLAEVGRTFEERATAELREALDAFREAHGKIWLDDFALYTAIKRTSDLLPWWEWEPELRFRDPDALAAARERLADEVHRVEVEQLCFDRQFRRLREMAADQGVGLIGDIPIFVANDSADVWANPELFQLDEDGRPTVVAGVPPDYFSETGQRWGNPLYDWERHAADGYAWWVRRMRRMTELFDLIRIDHFRGFASYWEIPASEPTAVNGRWVEGPGEPLFERLAEELGDLPVIAEDLGIVTPDVDELRDRLGLPGMRVLQFGFDPDSDHAPHRYPEQVVAYPGTHDNDTAVGWWRDDRPGRDDEREAARAMLEIDDETQVHWAMIEAVMRSDAALAVTPLQDLFGLGSEARMNTPGVEQGNWAWRFRWNQLTDEVVERMARLTAETDRVVSRDVRPPESGGLTS